MSSDSRDWLDLYGFFIAGHLASAGGILAQPAVYLEAMRAISTAVNSDA